MTTNILLIIVIVLLVLGLILQLFQLLAMMTIPERLLDALLDEFGANVIDVDKDVYFDLEPEDLASEKSIKGFAKSRKSKKARWTVPSKTQKPRQKNQKDKSKAKGDAEETEVEREVVN